MPGKIIQFGVERESQRHMGNGETSQRSSNWQARNFRRFDLEFPVVLKFQAASTSAEIEGVSKNISIGGLLVRSASPIPPHTPVVFVLSLHGTGAVRPVHLIGEGQVVRVEIEEPKASFILAVRCNSPVTQLEQYLPM